MGEDFRILVVDDEPIGRQLLEAVLFPEGYSILFAENGMEAYNVVLQEKPDLVLLDVMMPHMDGFETCKKIRETNEILNTPVFLITALDDRDSRIRGLDAGADDYLSKPFDRVEILAKVKNIRQNRKQSEDVPANESSENNSFKNLVPLVFNTERNVSLFKPSALHFGNKSNSYQNAFSFGYLKDGKFLALIGNNKNNDKAQQINFNTALVLQNTFFDTSTSNPMEDILNQLKQYNIDIDASGFFLTLVIEKHDSDEYLVSGINSSIFIQNGNFQNIHLTPTRVFKYNKETSIALLSSDMIKTIDTKVLGSRLDEYFNGYFDINNLFSEYNLSDTEAMAILR